MAGSDSVHDIVKIESIFSDLLKIDFSIYFQLI